MTMFGLRHGAVLLRHLPDGSMETFEWKQSDTAVSILSKSANYEERMFTFETGGVEWMVSMDDCIKTGDPVSFP